MIKNGITAIKKTISVFTAAAMISSCAVATVAVAGIAAENSSLSASATPGPNNIITTTGEKSRNISTNNYVSADRCSQVVNSYLIQNSDMTISRVENMGEKLLIETYSINSKSPRSTKTINHELARFGGFFSGKNYNFIVYGQNNMSESDNVEVMRIVKYSKDWKRLGSTSVKGANTQVPFGSGSLRMTESRGLLYIHTCHTMYKGTGTLNHEANMTFVIDQSSLSIKVSDYLVSAYKTTSYSSHSFNQFIKATDNYVYSLDHGDCYPRAIMVSKSESGVFDSSKVKKIYSIPLDNVVGDYCINDTGAMIGGFELSDDNCIIAGNAVNYETKNIKSNAVRNIFINITGKGMGRTKTIWVTKYSDSDNIKLSNPQLVKVTKNKFVIFWEETNSSGSIKTRFVVFDANGNYISALRTSIARLSDCQPVKCSDGMVRWYVTNDSSPVMYTLDPDRPISLSDEVKPTSVKFNINKVKIGNGETIQLSTTVYSKGADNKTVTLSSANNTVTVSGNKVKGIKTGKAYIIAKTVNGKEDTCSVVVCNAPSSVRFNKTNLTLGVGENYTLTATVNPGAASYNYKYSTSSSRKLQLTDLGNGRCRVKALAAGHADVTVKTYNGKTHTCHVTIKNAPKSIRFDPSSLKAKKGREYKLNTIIPEGSASNTRTFSTSNKSIVEIKKTSNTACWIVAKRPGVAYITVKTHNGKTATCKVTVS